MKGVRSDIEKSSKLTFKGIQGSPGNFGWGSVAFQLPNHEYFNQSMSLVQCSIQIWFPPPPPLLPSQFQTTMGKVNIIAECWVYSLKVSPGTFALGQVSHFSRGMVRREHGKQFPRQIQASRRRLSISTLQSEMCQVCPRDLKALGQVTVLEPSGTAQWDRQERHKLYVSESSFVPMFAIFWNVLCISNT